MLGKLLPIVFLVVGLGGGAGVGYFLKPEPPAEVQVENPCGDPVVAEKENGDDHHSDDPSFEFVKLNNQFVVPVVGENKIDSLVVLSLSIEVASGRREEVYDREPKLRDAFLQVLFDHANMGGFRGVFTSSTNMETLRTGLRETAEKVAGDLVVDVLIIDINRQDV